MDKQIPSRWRLNQYYYDSNIDPKNYPVFLKPEWGQNSNGIMRLESKEEYKQFHKVVEKTDMPFIVQDAALGKKEFEIYYLRSPDSRDEFSFLSITQVINSCRESHPVNSIHNPCTSYMDRTKSFSDNELQIIWNFIREIGEFRMARVGLKADNIKNILSGKFSIIEINLFLPMPLVLLAENVEQSEKKKIIRTTMSLTARLVNTIPNYETGRRIFFRKMKTHYKIAQ